MGDLYPSCPKCQRRGIEVCEHPPDDPPPKPTAEERMRAELVAHREKAIGNYWCWQGDGEDHPESLTCPVLVSADQVREWVAARSKAFEQAAREVNAETLSADPSGLCWSFREGVMPFAVSLEKRLRALAKEQADDS